MANYGPAVSADTFGNATAQTAEIGTIAAAGSTLATGTAVVSATTYVTGADGTKGVTLPAGQIGAQYRIFNHGGSALKVYPPSSSVALNGGTNGAAVSVGANKGGEFTYLTTSYIGAVYS